MSKGDEEIMWAKARRSDEGVQAHRSDGGCEAANFKKSIDAIDQVMKGLING